MYERYLQYKAGLINQEEFHKELDKLGIEGAIEFKDGQLRFIGFDYKRQNWIRIN